ncbi:MAG: hypothetical protein FJW40_25150 [Acidobacteria bacterium]|nr:hypothetical protein [Acidobacteriota bacterium]
MLAAAVLHAQTAAPRPGPAIPRLANGKPNFNGIWQAISSAHYDIERHMARHSLMQRPGPHGPLPAVQTLALGAVGAVPGGMGIVEGGRIPYKPEALKTRDENRARWVERDPEIKCFLPGIPRATYMPFPFEIVQNAGNFFFAYEFAGAYRNILFKDPGPAETDSWMGQAVGRWEGDTLVIDNSGFNDQSWFDRAGNHHSNQLRVVERLKLLGPNHIQYEATITDPETFTEPWKISLPLYRRMEKDARIMDFKCVEFVEELMFGEYRRNPLKR